MYRPKKYIKPTKIYVEQITDNYDNQEWPKKEGRKECLVSGPLALTLFVSRAIGLAPLRFRRRPNGWLISVSPFFCFYSYLFLGVLIAGLIFGLKLDFSESPDHAVRARMSTNFAFIIEMAIVMSTVMFGVFSSPLRMKNMIDNLNLLAKVNVKSSARDQDRYRLLLAILWLIGPNILYWMEYATFIQEAIDDDRQLTVACLYSCSYICYIILQVMEMQFVFLTFLVQSHLKLVNNSLKDLLYIVDLQRQTNPYRDVEDLFDDIVRPAKPFNIIIDSMALKGDKNDGGPHTSKLVQEAVRRLSRSYAAICDVVREVEKNNGFLMLLLTGCSFLYMILSPYYLVSYIFSPKKHTTLLLLQIFKCFLHLFNFILAVEPAHQTEKEMEYTEITVSQLMRRVTSPADPIAWELDLFSKQIALNKVCYTTLRICLLNRPLISEVFSGATTYVVIILQFQSMDTDD